MNRTVFAVIAAITLYSATASAQKVREYKAESSATTGSTTTTSGSGGQNATVWYPGMPVPKAAATTPAPTDAKPDGESAPTSSFVTQYSGDPAQKNKPVSLDLPQDKLYRGIIPGTRDDMPHLQRTKQESGNNVTWIGFQPTENGSRVFIQTSTNPNYTLDSAEKLVTVTLPGTAVKVRNFSRFIDTSFFNANVMRIETSQLSGDTIVKITLRKDATPAVDVSGNYLYLDF